MQKYIKISQIGLKKTCRWNKQRVGWNRFSLRWTVNRSREHKGFFNPAMKKAVVTYRGTDMRDPKRIWSDLRSDFNIMLGREKNDKRFQNANVQFQQAAEKYKKQGYTIDTYWAFLSYRGSSRDSCEQVQPQSSARKLKFQSRCRFCRTFSQTTKEFVGLQSQARSRVVGCKIIEGRKRGTWTEFGEPNKSEKCIECP